MSLSLSSHIISSHHFIIILTSFFPTSMHTTIYYIPSSSEASLNALTTRSHVISPAMPPAAEHGILLQESAKRRGQKAAARGTVNPMEMAGVSVGFLHLSMRKNTITTLVSSFPRIRRTRLSWLNPMLMMKTRRLLHLKTCPMLRSMEKMCRITCSTTTTTMIMVLMIGIIRITMMTNTTASTPTIAPVTAAEDRDRGVKIAAGGNLILARGIRGMVETREIARELISVVLETVFSM